MHYKKVLLKNIQEGDVFHFHPNDYSEFSNWCRENLFIARKDQDGKIWLVDTYWGLAGGSDSKRYSFTEANKLGKLEYYCNLNEIEQKDSSIKDYYDDEDIFVLHDQHACVESCRYYFLKKGAVKSKEKMLSVINEKIDKKEREINYLVSDLQRDSVKKSEIEKDNLEVYV